MQALIYRALCVCVHLLSLWVVCVCARLIGFTKIDQEVSFIIAKQINAEWALHIRSRMCVRMCLYISQLKPIAIIFDPRPRAPRSINCQCSPKTLLCSSSKRRRGFIFDVLPPVRLAPPPLPPPPDHSNSAHMLLGRKTNMSYLVRADNLLLN